MGWFFSDYRVSPNFLLCWGWVVVEVGLGCDNLQNIFSTLRMASVSFSQSTLGHNSSSCCYYHLMNSKTHSKSVGHIGY